MNKFLNTSNLYKEWSTATQTGHGSDKDLGIISFKEFPKYLRVLFTKTNGLCFETCKDESLKNNLWDCTLIVKCLANRSCIPGNDHRLSTH